MRAVTQKASIYLKWTLYLVLRYQSDLLFQHIHHYWIPYSVPIQLSTLPCMPPHYSNILPFNILIFLNFLNVIIQNLTLYKMDMDLEKDTKNLTKLRKKWCCIVQYVNSPLWFYQQQEGVDTIIVIIVLLETLKQARDPHFAVLSAIHNWNENNCFFLHQQILDETQLIFGNVSKLLNEIMLIIYKMVFYIWTKHEACFIFNQYRMCVWNKL